MRVTVSPALPLLPSMEEDVVRAVRHGLADVLEWLGEEVGPHPGDAVHALRIGGTLYVSPALLEDLKRASLTGRQDYR